MRDYGANRGWTLLEMLLTIGIAGLLVTGAGTAWSSLTQNQRIQGLAQELSQHIQWLHSEAASRQESIRLSWYQSSQGACYVSHTGAANQCSCLGQQASCQAPAKLLRFGFVPDRESIKLSSTSSSMLWDPVAGTTTPTGTIRLESTSGQSVRVVVNILGRARTCTDAATWSMLPRCT